MAKLPDSPSVLGHIFRVKKGHVEDTPANRELLVAAANDPASWTERDKFGNDWFYRQLPDGTQVWAQVYDDIIINGGINLRPYRKAARENR